MPIARLYLSVRMMVFIFHLNSSTASLILEMINKATVVQGNDISISSNARLEKALRV